MQLYKARDFSALFQDTFAFVKRFGKHFFKHFFIVNDNVMVLEDKLFDDYINVNSQTKIGFMASSTESDDPYGKGKNNKLTLIKT